VELDAAAASESLSGLQLALSLPSQWLLASLLQLQLLLQLVWELVLASESHRIARSISRRYSENCCR
jgi:hypothetical protein